MWYAENDIESSMSDRMKHKDERKKIKTDPSEPQANVKVVKKELHSPTFTPSSASYDESPSVYPHPYAAYAPMYSWADHPYLSHRQDSVLVEDNDQQAPRQASLMPRKRKVKSEMPRTGDMDEDDDTSKLKGVVWPGMGLFDAATPELKKMRNQKKDISVNENLATMSERVQKEELIFSSSGGFHKKRPITGQPQPEDDVLPGEELPDRPPKAKRASKKKTSDHDKSLEDKKPLKEKDSNTRMKLAPLVKPKKRGRKQQSIVAADIDDQEENHAQEEASRKTKRVKRKTAPVDEAEEEGEDQIDMEEATFEQPVVMTQLTSGYQHAP
ncbi:hypothetical protein E4T44_14618, partial [Aureobasidium sp. EXF-8845]